MTEAAAHLDWFEAAYPTVENTLHVSLDTLRDVQARAALDGGLAADVASAIAQTERLLAVTDFAALTGANPRKGGAA